MIEVLLETEEGNAARTEWVELEVKVESKGERICAGKCEKTCDMSVHDDPLLQD